jgi:hypothetical protein
MKKLDLGQTLQLLGSAGVIVGILLLVFELNQNRDMIRAQTRNELSSNLVELAIADSTDLALADVLSRGLNDGEQGTPAEQWIVMRRANAWFRYWENVHYQGRIGTYDEVEFSKQLEAIRSALAIRAGLVKYWCGARESYSPEFAAEIDAMLTTHRCE